MYTKAFFFLIFKIVELVYGARMACQVSSPAIQSLMNFFAKTIYLSYFCDGNSPQKTIERISNLAKKPKSGVTFAIQIENQQVSDMPKLAMKIKRLFSLINQAVEPNQINCFFQSESKEISKAFENCLRKYCDLPEKAAKIRIFDQIQEFEVGEQLSARKNDTQLVICFGNYASIFGLPYKYLIGAEIAFNKGLLETSFNDLANAFEQFSNSEQRKGK